MPNQNTQIKLQYTSDESAVWLQPEGCGTVPVQIGCIGVDSISVPRGEVTKIVCVDPVRSGSFITQASIRSAPEDIEIPLLANIGAQAGWLNKLTNERHCPFPIYVLLRCKGRKNNFARWELAFRVNDAEITTVEYSNLVARSEVNGLEKTYTLKASAASFREIYMPVLSTQSVAAVEDIQSITFCGDTECGGPCGDYQRDCETGFAIGKAATASKPVVSQALTNCIGWESITSVTRPFPTHTPEVQQHATSLICSNITSFPRLITGRLTTLAGEKTTIAYSDDKGLNWTNIEVGGVNGSYVPTPNSIIQRNDGTIWLINNDAQIFVSYDNGVNWYEKHNGALLGDAFAISFRDDYHGLVVGENGDILVTDDGGDAWYLLTDVANSNGQNSPTNEDITCVAHVDRNWYIGTTSGKLFRTRDLIHWHLIPFSGQLNGSIADIKFQGCSGILLFNSGGGSGEVLYTINGYDWELLTTPPNSGLNSVTMLSDTEFYIAGNAHNGHGLIIKGTAYPTT